MAGPLKRYGQYFVFAAMATTGVFVWNSNRRDLNGESYAELYNAAVERLAVPALVGEELPTWPKTPQGGTNLFPSAVLTKEFRDGMLLLTTRATFGGTNTTVGAASETYPNGSVSGVSWSNEVQWLLSTNSLYEGSASFISSTSAVQEYPDDEYTDALGYVWASYGISQTNLVDGGLTAKTVAQPASISFPSGVPTTNAPLWRTVWGLGKTASGVSFGLPQEGCFWSTNISDSAYLFPAQKHPADRVLRLRDLTGPATVITQLTTTVRNVTLPEVNVNIKIYDDTQGGLGTDRMLDEVLAVVLGGGGLVYEDDRDEYPPVWENSLRGVSSSVLYEYGGSPPNYEYAGTSLTFSKVIPTSFMSGQTLEYPSRYAVTNGLVRRIRVFGIFGPSISHLDAGLPGQPSGETNIVPYLTFSTHFTSTPGQFPGFAFSEPMSTFSTNGYTGEFNEGNPGSHVDMLAGGAFRSGLGISGMSPVVALLHEELNPTNVISWSDIAIPTLTDMSAPNASSLEWWLTDHPRTNVAIPYLRTEYAAEYYQDLEVHLMRAFVVVDWDWKHLNPANPYVPPE